MAVKVKGFYCLRRHNVKLKRSKANPITYILGNWRPRGIRYSANKNIVLARYSLVDKLTKILP